MPGACGLPGEDFDYPDDGIDATEDEEEEEGEGLFEGEDYREIPRAGVRSCLLYTSDAADE